MSYFLSDEQEMIRDTARNFARDVIEPLAVAIDETETTPSGLVRQVADLGFFGTCIPEEYGGLGGQLTTACVVLEELAKASPAFAGLLSVQMILCPLTVNFLGNEEQKLRLLPPSATGERLMAYSQTEPSGAANVGAHLTRLTPAGNGWILNGEKLFCSRGEAQTFLVMCKTARDGAEGYGCVIVDGNTDGFAAAPHEDKLGWRGTNTGSISFSDVHVPASDVLGDLLTAGADHFMVANQASFLGHAATALGCAEGMFDKTLAYVRERNLYGQPMHSLQPISYWLSEVHNKIEAARCLLYSSTRLYDEGRIEKPMGSVCKSWICNTMFECTHQLLQMWGGNGIMNSTGINRYMRDARTKMIAEGASEMHGSLVSQLVLGLQ